MRRTLPEYDSIIGPVAASKLKQVASELKGARVVHVNSTREGGGVAEILFWMIPLMNELGLEASWEVIEGNQEYFNTTKSFHNGLQGNKVALTDKMIKAYEDTVAANADRLRDTLEEADFVIIHDPQPAMLYELSPKRKGKWIWRCHINGSGAVISTSANLTEKSGIISVPKSTVMIRPYFRCPISPAN
jgi:trehalose synthase